MSIQKSTGVLLLAVVILNLFVVEICAKRGIAIARRKQGSGKSYNSRRGRGQDHGHSDGMEGVGYGHVDRVERHAAVYEPVAYLRHKRSAHPNPQLDDWLGLTWDPKIYKPIGPPNIESLKGIPSSYGQSIDDVQSYSGRYIGNYGAYTYGYPRNYLKVRNQMQPQAIESSIPLAEPFLDPELSQQFSELESGYPNTAWKIIGDYGHGFGYGNLMTPYKMPKDKVLQDMALWKHARGYKSFPLQHRINIDSDTASIEVTNDSSELIDTDDFSASHEEGSAGALLPIYAGRK